MFATFIKVACRNSNFLWTLEGGGILQIIFCIVFTFWANCANIIEGSCVVFRAIAVSSLRLVVSIQKLFGRNLTTIHKKIIASQSTNLELVVKLLKRHSKTVLVSIIHGTRFKD